MQSGKPREATVSRQKRVPERNIVAEAARRIALLRRSQGLRSDLAKLLVSKIAMSSPPAARPRAIGAAGSIRLLE